MLTLTLRSEKNMFKKILILSIAVLCVLSFSACNEKQPESTQSDDKISNISTNDSFKKDITNLINDYFNAIKAHNHQDILMCTTEDFKWNYNQTDFENSVRFLTDASIDEIEFEHIQNDSGKYTVPLKYTFKYSEEYTDENGQSGGEYLFYDDFVITKTDNDSYKIFDTRHKGAG